MQNPLNLGPDFGAIGKAKMGGEIITQTLDKINDVGSDKKPGKSGNSGMEQSYEFNKSILSAAYDAKGIGIDSKG